MARHRRIAKLSGWRKKNTAVAMVTTPLIIHREIFSGKCNIPKVCVQPLLVKMSVLGWSVFSAEPAHSVSLPETLVYPLDAFCYSA